MNWSPPSTGLPCRFEAGFQRRFAQGAAGKLATVEILETLRQTYCSTIGVEYMYMTDYDEKRWLQDKLESIRSRPTFNSEQKKRILERLTAAETLERYRHTKYVGQKRFSLEKW